MGTNYYLHKNACKCCKRSQQVIHIGKSSGGWCFSLRVYPPMYPGDESDSPLLNFEQWKALIEDPASVILDEYDSPVDATDMLKTISERSWPKKSAMTAADLSRNHAFEGPNNLLRHIVDGSHCIGNGEGTWDYIVGDFS